IIYINSTNTMDYIVALALVLGSTYFVVNYRPWPAGILLGLAVGCRITSGAMILPLTLHLLLATQNPSAIKAGFSFVLTTLLVSFLCFLPVFNRYGLAFLTFSDYHSYPSLWNLLIRSGADVWGWLGLFGLWGLAILLSFRLPRCREAFKVPKVRHGLVLATLSIAIYTIAFFRLPVASGYLIPTVPFLLLIVGLLAPPNFGKAFAIVVMLSAFLITSSHGNINLVGPIFVDHNDRVALRQDTSYIIEAIEQLRPGAVIVAGWRMSQIEVALDKEVWGKHEFYYLLENVEEFNRYTTAGHQVYFLPGVDIQNQRVNGIALEQLGAKPIYSNR
ncbi:MAG: hypothetical protein R2867_32630, partial [Caldilineaceae bacterium]